MEEIYRTLRGLPDGEGFVLIEKKSRFIATGGPAYTEAEAAAWAARARERWRDASHHVFACRVGTAERYSDDGEPSGTGGLPLLGLLQKADLRYCAIVVTRYFGGTLLGAGGLARAYGACAKGFADANAVTMALRLCCKVTVDYTYVNIIQNALQKDAVLKENVTIEGVGYTDKAAFRLLCAPGGKGAFIAKMADLTHGGVAVEMVGEKYTEV